MRGIGKFGKKVLGFLVLLAVFGFGNVWAQTCQNLVCSDAISTCSSVSGSTVTLNPNACDGDGSKSCVFYQDFRHSECMKKSDEQPLVLYPAYYCGSNYPDGTCAFAEKACKDGMCLGVHPYGTCYRSGDCYRGDISYFCQSGKCVPEVGIGKYCTSHEACGREGYCLFSSIDANFGIGVEYASIETNSVNPILAEKNGAFLYQQDAEKVCKSGWVDMNTGKGGVAAQSTNKGNACSTDADCPTTESGVNASCKCALNGEKLCDIHGGDKEWQNAFTLFQDYIKATKEYHVAERFGSCMNSDEYKEWFGAEFEAKHYVELLKKPDGFQEFAPNYDVYSEYMKTCRSFLSSIYSAWLGLLIICLFLYF